MKKFLIFAVLLIGCDDKPNNYSPHGKLIVTSAMTHYNDKRYVEYSVKTEFSVITVIDSIGRFNIGDTLILTKIKRK